MKKTTAIISAVLLLIGFVGACHVEHNYTRKECAVIAATDTGAIFEDACGWQWYWEYEEGEQFKVGEVANLKMHDNFTSAYIDDDVIKKVVKK